MRNTLLGAAFAVTVLCMAPTSVHKKAKAAAAPKVAPYYAHTPAEFIPYKNLRVKYYHDNFYLEPQKWLGPGREIPEPKVKEVKIGWLGPPGDYGPLAEFGKQMLQGSQLAIDRANAAGGYKGKPFRLSVHIDRARWGDSSNAMVKMVYDEGVWGVLGSMDSANSHVMMRTTLKFPVPVVNTATTDQTLMEHRVPFIIRTIPDDRQFAYAATWYLYKEKKYNRATMIRINNRDGRFAINKLLATARRIGHPYLAEVRFMDGASDFKQQIDHVKQFNSDAVVVWGNPRETALVVKQMRAMGMNQPVIGWFRAIEPSLIQLGGKDVEGMVLVSPWDPTRSDPLLKDFQARYRKRFGMEPDAFAAYAYDGMDILINSIRKAGLNRVKIADANLAIKSYHGVSGMMEFDGARNNVCPIYLAQVKNGKFVYRRSGLPRDDVQRTASGR